MRLKKNNMAYARLFFPDGISSSRKLKELVRFCCGEILSASELEFASKELSEILIAQSPGWRLPFGNQFNDFSSEYSLESRCIDPTKNKTIKIIARQKITTVSQVVSLLPITSNDTEADAWLLAESSALNSYYPNTLIPSVINSQFNLNAKIDLAASDFYISCSKYHIFILSSSNINSFVAAIEFPETNYSKQHNLIPITLIGAAFLNDPNINCTLDYDTNSVSSQNINCELNRYQILPFWKSSENFKIKSRSSLFDFNTLFDSSSSKFNITNSSFILTPILESRHKYGEGLHHYSALSNMFLTHTPQLSSITGQEISYNGFTFVLLNIGSLGKYATIAARKF